MIERALLIAGGIFFTGLVLGFLTGYTVPLIVFGSLTGLIVFFVMVFIDAISNPNTRFTPYTDTDDDYIENDEDGDEILGLIPGPLNPNDDLDDRRDY